MRFVVFRIGCAFWWLSEWFEAIGDSCEDFALVVPGSRKWPWQHRQLRNKAVTRQRERIFFPWSVVMLWSMLWLLIGAVIVEFWP